MSAFYDALETRSADAREAALLAALPGQINHAKAKSPYFARLLAEVVPAAITTRQALAALPVTRKSELTDLQAADAPFGGLTATPTGARAGPSWTAASTTPALARHGSASLPKNCRACRCIA